MCFTSKLSAKPTRIMRAAGSTSSIPRDVRSRLTWRNSLTMIGLRALSMLRPFVLIQQEEEHVLQRRDDSFDVQDADPPVGQGLLDQPRSLPLVVNHDV